jgi:hypothetical protein
MLDAEKNKFICNDCGEEVHISALDFGKYAARGFICESCWSCIAFPRYKKNIKGGKTIFSPLGGALGDAICFEFIHNFYKVENPDETVLLMDSPHEAYIFQSIYEKEKPDKIFWADLTNMKNAPIFIKLTGDKYQDAMTKEWADNIVKHNPMENIVLLKRNQKIPKVIKYSVVNEAVKIAQKGFYWTWPEDYKHKPNIEIPPNFILLHLRNIRKADFKNEKYWEAYHIVEKLQRLQNDIKVLLIGNDAPYGFEPEFKNLIDLRNQLTLHEIAWLSDKAICLLAKDSGMPHLVGVSGGKVIAYGYQQKEWMPLMEQKEKRICFMNERQGFVKFSKEIDKLVAQLNNQALQIAVQH